MPSIRMQHCKWCGKEFAARIADINRGWAKFCSVSCKAKEQESRTHQHSNFLQGLSVRDGGLQRGQVNVIAVSNGSGKSIVADVWLWRQKGGIAYTRPAEMHTGHLFYTLRMIWNHTMPHAMHVGRNVRYYELGPSYTKEYLKQAIVHIGTELLSRNDIRPSWQRELNEMMAHFQVKNFMIEEELKRLE